MTTCIVGGRALVVSGRVVRSARLRDEPYEWLERPSEFIEQLAPLRPRIDLFSFAQNIADQVPRHSFHLEWDRLAALRLTTYERWFKKEIDFKVRNKIRKAEKAGIEIRNCELNDALVIAIMGLYNESPLIQGRRNWHYGKSFEAMREMLSTFPEKSLFIGAFLKDELIGFIKLVDVTDGASLMHIISMTAHRDKAPTNRLLARAVEVCTEKNLSHLHYALWSRRGLGVFKMNHGFEPYQIPRYFVPMTAKGKALLKLGLHRGLRTRLPETWVDSIVELRNRVNEFRYRTVLPSQKGASRAAS